MKNLCFLSFLFLSTNIGYSKNYYWAISEAIDKNDSLLVEKLIIKGNGKSGYSMDLNEYSFRYSIEKENNIMINYFIRNNIANKHNERINKSIIYAAEINKDNICRILLENGADPNYSIEVDSMYYFDSIYVTKDKIEQRVIYQIDDNGECWVSRENWSTSTKSTKFKSEIPVLGSNRMDSLFSRMTLESYLGIETKVVKYNPKRGNRTAMYYAIEHQNSQLIKLLSKFGYDFSRSYIIKSMKSNLPQWGPNNGVRMPSLLEWAVMGTSHGQTNWYVINGHTIYATIPPTPAVFCKPLNHAILMKSNSNILDLIRQNSK
jgi:hypothetical protein